MKECAKAIVAGLTIFGAEFHMATLLDSVGGTAVTANEWVVIGVSTVVASLAVWATSNEPSEPVK